MPDKGNMPWDRKRLLGYVETIQLILGVTDKCQYVSQYPKMHSNANIDEKPNFVWFISV